MTDLDTSGWGPTDQPQTEDMTTFPDAWKDEFEGLLFLGYLQKEVTQVPFHKFVIRTLTVKQKIEISLMTKDYVDTIGFNRAWKAASVAAALVSVDGRELIAGSKNVNSLQQRYEYITNNWYDIVIEILFNELEQLENRVILVLYELGIIKTNAEQDIFADSAETNDIPKDGN
jgi:hypothetical protein